ncbi:MAG: hypothetical protein II012_01705, partial [Ruminococcus sp.]|nr:hypothetical protein [Ruminococcus sp.]
MAIITLGVGFFAGIKATAPSMYQLAETYYREKRLMDFRLVSTVGFAEEDIQSVAETEGVQSVMPSYFCDVMTSADDGGDIVRLIALPKAYQSNRTLNTLTINEGRSVRRSGEIITESVAFANARHKVGATVTFAPTAGDNKLTELLNVSEFKIVGKAESPLYISYQRGSTTIGDGKIDEYMYISAEDFKLPRYTELYVKAAFSDEVSAFSDDYAQQAAQMKERLEALSRVREAAFVTEVIPNAEQELADGKTEFETKRDEAESKLGEALDELNAGEEKYNTAIKEAEDKLAAAKEQLDSGEAALQAGEDSYAAGIAAGEQLLAEGAAQLAEGVAQLEAGKALLAEQLQAYQGDDAQTKTTRDTVDAVGSAQTAAGQAQLFAGQAQLAVGKAEMLVQSLSGQLQLSAARQQLSAGKQQYETGLALLKEQKKTGAQELADAKAAYQKARDQADKELADAEQKIKDGEAAIQKLHEMKSEWYVFDRAANPGYSTFGQNADRLDAVASVFPLFFLLVAVLVCVTTMTRLIEEKRTEIATLKALGYGSGSIVLKYVIYSLTAAVAGSAIGVFAGINTLPFIIYDAYRIMFYIGNIELVPHMPSIVLGTLAAVVCTTAVSVIVCAKSLHVKPAQAMRPKAPKPGKRILLERIAPLWKHMNFTAKLTARNLFRYKVRMCMTVIGVAGCTALIVAAFGLLDSFQPLTHAQFNEIFKYDAVVLPKKGGTAQELGYLKESADKTGKVKNALLALQEETTVRFGNKESAEYTYISVPETADVPEDMLSLHTRADKTPLSLSDDGVLLNEKLASDLGIREGDSIWLDAKNGGVSVRVDGIYEQYIYSYVYMSPQCYETLFGKAPVFNLLQV